MKRKPINVLGVMMSIHSVLFGIVTRKIRMFVLLAGISALFHFVIHIYALLGLENPVGKYFTDTFWWSSVLIVWIPAITVSAEYEGLSLKQTNFKDLLKGCPGWMKVMTFFFMGYGILTTLAFQTLACVRDSFCYGDIISTAGILPFCFISLGIFYSRK